MVAVFATIADAQERTVHAAALFGVRPVLPEGERASFSIGVPGVGVLLLVAHSGSDQLGMVLLHDDGASALADLHDGARVTVGHHQDGASHSHLGNWCPLGPRQKMVDYASHGC